jgi:cytochrome P450
MDPDIFDNPKGFRYDRFLDPDATGKKGTKLSTHLRPFGGGVHMCPGRKFIGYEARAVLATILLNYDVRLKDGETRPEIDFTRQGMSVSVPERDVDIEARIRSSRTEEMIHQ